LFAASGGIEFRWGNISFFTELCEQARKEAFNLIVKHADEIGANAIVGMCYDANEMADGVAEVLALVRQ
jgi:uncharacterized protein YbjQ (UPF0145 family)